MMARLFILVTCGLFLSVAACSTQYTVLEGDLEPGQQFGTARIDTNSGAYQFDRVLVTADSLVGEYEVEVQRRSSTDGVYYEDVTRARAVPRNDVVSVTSAKRDGERTLFFGVGTVAVGLLLRDVFETQLDVGGGGSSKSKPNPNG